MLKKILLFTFFGFSVVNSMDREFTESHCSMGRAVSVAQPNMTPKSDIIFKMLFANQEHPNILINLLNAVLKADIREIQIEQTELTPEYVGDKSVRLDVIARTGSGEIINVEIQRRDEGNMIPRTLFYWSKLFSGQAVVGQNYKDLKRTVCINILDFSLFKDTEYWHKLFLMDDRTKEKITDLLEIHFLELKKQVQIDSSEPVTFWLEFLNSPRSEAIRYASEIQEAKELYERVITDPSTQKLYEAREKGQKDLDNALSVAEERGREEERRKGEVKSNINEILSLSKYCQEYNLIAQEVGVSQDFVDFVLTVKTLSKEYIAYCNEHGEEATKEIFIAKAIEMLGGDVNANAIREIANRL